MIQHIILDWMKIFIILIYVLIFIGAFKTTPTYAVEIIFVFKLIIASYLIYRFNKGNKNKIKFTELDRRVCFSAGFFIFFISFADVINSYIEKIKNYLIKNVSLYNYLQNFSKDTKTKIETYFSKDFNL
jgi:phosphatidylglycerophosphate synthase